MERAELGYQLAIEVALADPALGLDEAKIDVDSEQRLDLRSYSVGQFSAHECAAALDETADLADEGRAGGTKPLQRGNLALHGVAVARRALRQLAAFEDVRAAKGRLGVGAGG